MLVNFHEDPINLAQLCFDLRNDAFAVIFTTRPNFRDVHKAVDAQMDGKIIPLSVEDHDHDWHHYLINTDIEEFDSDTPNLILKAVEQWKRVGCPFPFAARI